ncbi:MAG TPA: undecaprenyl-diphosphate phosphatase, partial [candidate division Zixibacteria bacterium]|nr:undecaprenyl-diphosphate phosphatase [candidate division Zixibacteria bacterium]
ASIPAAVIGLAFKTRLLGYFDNGSVASTMLIATGIILLSTLFAKKSGAKIGVSRAISIGLAQAVAIIPGISRSGITIVTARHTGVDGEKAAKFSFFMAIPVIGGATLLHLVEHAREFEAYHILGIAISAVVGYISLKILIEVLDKGKLWVFGPYCLALGIISLIAIT